MAEIIAITNQKGGVAKTTTALALATGLTKRGFKVLMVDTDAQRNSTGVYQAESDGVATLHDLLFTKGVTPEMCVQHTELGDIVASDKLMAKDDANLNGVRESLILKKALKPFDNQYDFIILDHNPGHGGILNNILTAANTIIIPMEPEGFSVDGAVDLAEKIDSIKEFTNPNLKVAGILLVKYNGRTTDAKNFMDESHVIEELFQAKIFSTKIRRCQALSSANTRRMSIFDYDPKGNGAVDYGALIDEFLEEINNR